MSPIKADNLKHALNGLNEIIAGFEKQAHGFINQTAADLYAFKNGADDITSQAKIKYEDAKFNLQETSKNLEELTSIYEVKKHFPGEGEEAAQAPEATVPPAPTKADVTRSTTPGA